MVQIGINDSAKIMPKMPTVLKMPTMRLKYNYFIFIIIGRKIEIQSRNIPYIWGKHNITILEYNSYQYMYGIFS